MDTKNSSQQGAPNIQRFGRACGLLKQVIESPIVIATETIMMEALANENLLFEKAKVGGKGGLISLAEFVTKDEWLIIKKKLSKKDNENVEVSNLTRDISTKSQTLKLLKLYYDSFLEKHFTRENIKENNNALCINQKNHNRNHCELITRGFIREDSDGYIITMEGLVKVRNN